MRPTQTKLYPMKICWIRDTIMQEHFFRRIFVHLCLVVNIFLTSFRTHSGKMDRHSLHFAWRHFYIRVFLLFCNPFYLDYCLFAIQNLVYWDTLLQYCVKWKGIISSNIITVSKQSANWPLSYFKLHGYKIWS